MGMRLVVSSPGPSLVLAYAEYRFLSVLARHQDVRSARVTLRSGADATVLCSVRIAFDPSGSACARASGEYAAAAIERAVDRVGQLMRDRRTAGGRRHGAVLPTLQVASVMFTLKCE